jgi:hypothetical protein
MKFDANISKEPTASIFRVAVWGKMNMDIRKRRRDTW